MRKAIIKGRKDHSAASKGGSTDDRKRKISKRIVNLKTGNVQIDKIDKRDILERQWYENEALQGLQ